MKKQEMVTLLRSAGVDENAVTLATNAWEMGAESQKEDCLGVFEGLAKNNMICSYETVTNIIREMP